MSKIKIGIVGIGNCASSLIQGIHYYTPERESERVSGLMHWAVGGFRPCDIDVVSAFDVDSRKVGKDVNEAIFAEPNCTTVFQADIPKSGTIVKMGTISDGVSEHMANFPAERSFVVADEKELSREEIVAELKESGTEILLNYLPVGSKEATEFYAQCALDAGVAFINNMPIFIASNPEWAEKFKERNIPIVGDDIKAQMGATITHRTLTDLFAKRGVIMERTYQLNTGGNTDFLNMKNADRLEFKKESKTEAVQAVASERLDDVNIHVGPSDYVPWQKDNKLAFIRLEGNLFGDVPMNVEVRLSVEDSPNSAGVAIDMIRCCKLAKDAGIGGLLEAPSAYFCKHPPIQHTDDVAYEMVNDFINTYSKTARAAE